MLRYIILILGLIISVASSASSSLTSMLIEPNSKHTNITFSLTKKTFGKVKYSPNPHRVIIEFKDTYQHMDTQLVNFAGSNVKSMQMQSLKPHTLQFTFYMREAVHIKARFVNSNLSGAHLRLEMVNVNNNQSKTPAIKSVPNSPVIETVPASKVVEKIAEKPLTRAANEPVFEFKKPTITTVVIDAGHGGRDPGAKGVNGVKEKTVVLAIAKKTRTRN